MKKYLIPILVLIAVFIPKLSFADTVLEDYHALQNLAINNGGSYTLTKDNSPYVFLNNQQIDENVTINIDPGVTLQTSNKIFFIKNGIVNFNGSAVDPINYNANYDFITTYIESFDGTNPVANFNYVNFNSCGYGVLAGDLSTVTVKNSSFNCSFYSVYAQGRANLKVDNIKNLYLGNVHPNFDFIQIVLSPNQTADTHLNVEIKNTDFPQDLKHVVSIWDFGGNGSQYSNISLHGNTFSGDVQNKMPIAIMDNSFTFNVDATGNYWGTDQGPYVTGSSNPTNGPQLPSNVLFDPFLPFEPSQYAECCSSVLFIPGIEGSRLYNKRTDNSEDQLWEPNTPADIEDLYGDAQGNTDPGIYTRDIVKETNVGLGGSVRTEKFYKKLSENLVALKEQNKINDYKELPYDWRENVEDILTNGIKLENSTVNVLDEIQSLANNSQTGKVTIIAHSNGGLLTKAIVKKLEEQGKANFVDKVVFVGVPQTGTPEAIYDILHGLNFTDLGKIFAPQKYNRALAQNTESAYSLLPSQAFYTPGTVPVYFDSSLGAYGNLISSYGSEVDSYAELKQFILGQLDGRGEADFSNTSQIGLGNEYLYNKAESVHSSLDNYNMPSSIKFYKVSGTGEYTNQSILYKSRSNLIGNKNPIPMLIKNIYGDGTVLNKSSNWGNGDLYYFDLYNYNKDTKNDLSHADIFEANPILDFVKNIITGLPNSVNYISQNLPDYSNVKTTKISMHSPVDIHLYDSTGRHTGPVYVNGQKYIEENVPNSKYEIIGDVASIIITGDEEYHLKLDGYDTGTFTLDIEKFTENTQTSFNTFENLPVNTNLSSDITISPDVINNQIILDTNSDGKLDLQANSNGTLVDLTKHDCSGKIKDKKHKDKDKDKECRDKFDKDESDKNKDKEKKNDKIEGGKKDRK